jgi:hypothetical protein
MQLKYTDDFLRCLCLPLFRLKTVKTTSRFLQGHPSATMALAVYSEDFDFSKFVVCLYVHENPPRLRKLVYKPASYFLSPAVCKSRLLNTCPRLLISSSSNRLFHEIITGQQPTSSWRKTGQIGSCSAARSGTRFRACTGGTSSRPPGACLDCTTSGTWERLQTGITRCCGSTRRLFLRRRLDHAQYEDWFLGNVMGTRWKSFMRRLCTAQISRCSRPSGAFLGRQPLRPVRVLLLLLLSEAACG